MMPQPPQEETEIACLYIPESAVGAVIGSKGTNIKNIMRLSGARIKVGLQLAPCGKKTCHVCF